LTKNLFEGVSPLSPERHNQYFLSTDTGYKFASEQPFAPLQISEFSRIAGEYAIAFLKQAETFRPIAVLGLSAAENLFVDQDGDWKAQYIPAFFRMYPFALIKLKDKDPMVLGIAEQYHGLNKEKKGEALFDESGKAGKIVKDVEAFAAQAARAAELTDRFVSDLSGLDIFAPIGIRLKGPEDASRVVSGLHAVDRKKLAELDPDILLGMVKSGALEAIYLHLASLRNLKDLARRLGHEADVPEDTADDDVTGEDNIFRSRFRN
jgi:hypothetical protein